MTSAPVLLLSFLAPAAVHSGGETVAFETKKLTGDFLCEGASFGDLNRDGAGDVVAGPYWYEGPTFEKRRELYPPKVFDPLKYSDHFFDFVHDVNGDSWPDLFVVGFPGREAVWYENPRGEERHWPRHLVHAQVDNESPAFTDLVGDEAPELVFHTGGVVGWATPLADEPGKPWTFHPITGNTGRGKFTHGLGVGDVDGDGRRDVLVREGWWRQPESVAGDPRWEFHEHAFSTGQGGAQMYTCDVDGDGDMDVITSKNAHGYGLSWFEQVERDGSRDFVEHRIMDEAGTPNSFGVGFSELHALDLVDVDGDGLLDVVTGKRFWSHGPKGERGAGDPAVLYWFELSRAPSGDVSFIPRLIHDDSGVGVQVDAGDVNGDGLVDVVVGNKKGTFVHLQRAAQKDAESTEEGGVRAGEVPGGEMRGGEIRGGRGGTHPRARDGRVLNLGFEDGTLGDWTVESGTAFNGQPVRGDTVLPRRDDMTSGHDGEYWIGTYELDGDAPEGVLTSEPFVASKRWASFLVAGGKGAATRVEVIVTGTGEVLASVSGRDHESLRPAVVDLEAHVGAELQVRLVDGSSGGWGHLNYDDLRLHDERPVFDDESLDFLDVVLHGGLSPGDAAAAMTVPDGFEVDLIAAEPDLHQPIAITIDERGRLWVAEAHAYPRKRADGDGEDQLLIFSDEDGDGSFETRKVFATGLNLVSGLATGFGGVFVGAAPELLFIPDEDGDDRPDGPPEVLLDGWGHEDTHETLNAFIFGPDGWLYGCHGVFTHSRVGAPGTPAASRVPINAGVWRYHPVRRDFEVFAWGSSNPWGVDFDDHGQAFITACVIPHLFHVVQGARYHRQAGEHFNSHVYDDIETIADHRHWIGSSPHSGNNRSSSAGGGHAHCGAMIYLGDAFPAEYRGRLFMNNVHGNRVNSDSLERAGSGFVGRHEDDFLLANDRWFRGINLTTGPDGAVYFIDWYDERSCHSNDVDVWTRTNGRLYRVRHSASTARAVSLAGATQDELVALHEHDNDWYVRTARRLLQEEGASWVAQIKLGRMLATHPDPRRRLRALWTLHATGGLSELHLRALLVGGVTDDDYTGAPLFRLRDADDDEYVRAWAIQLMLERRAPSGPGLLALLELARRDPSPVVRLYLASGLQRLPLADRWEIAQALAAHGEDAGDHNIPLVLWYGVEPLVPEDPERALALADSAELPLLFDFIHRRAGADARSHPALVRALGALESDDKRLRALEEVLVAVRGRRDLAAPEGWRAAYKRLRTSEDDGVRDRALALAAVFGDEHAFPELRALLRDPEAPAERRELALGALLAKKDAATAPLLVELLGDEAVQRDAIRALASYDEPTAPDALVALYASLGEEARKDVLSTLVSRATYARALLVAVGDVAVGDVAVGDVAVGDEGVPRSALSAVELRQLRAFEDGELDALVESVWGVFRPTPEDRVREIERWHMIATPERLAGADRSNGRDVYARTCMQCHILFGEGGDVGPELTGSNRSDLGYLLENVIAPSAVVPNEYRATIVLTEDGRLLTGVLKSEAEGTLVLATQNERIVVAREDVDEMRLDALSMMPEGQLETLSEVDALDLFAYLAGDAKVPRRLTAENAGELFDGATLAGWSGNADLWTVAGGEIIGRATEPLERNEFLRSDWELGDFRLTLEVKLTPNEANSGVQFRSEALADGDVKGYQADIGAGWWGKLYEEHGRAVLAGEPRDSVVRPGDWNEYEVLAVGDHVQTAINGNPCVDLVDSAGARRGIVALQMHSGAPFEIRFRNIRVELDPDPVLATAASR